jgi:hypothetical protein
MSDNGSGAAAISNAAALNTAYVESFKAGFEQAFQQTESKLQPYFEQESQNEEFQYFDRIGVAEEMTEDATRYGDNPNSDISHDRRRIGLKDYELGKYIDEKDLKRVLTDPMNAYTQALLASGKRKIDDIIIDRIFGEAYTGRSGGTTVTFSRADSSTRDTNITIGNLSKNEANPIIDTYDAATAKNGVDIVAGNTEGFSIGANYDGTPTGGAAPLGLTLEKLKAARRTMLRLEAIGQDDVVNCFLTSTQFNDLLGIEEIINSDYAVRKSLAEGAVTTFMGFRFIQTERLGLNNDGANNDERRVIVATPKALKMSIGTSLKGDVWRVPAKKNIPYVYFKLCSEASRMWGEVTGEIRCLEA